MPGLNINLKLGYYEVENQYFSTCRGGVILLAACGKDDSGNPKIEKLKAKVAQLSGEVRAACEVAKTQPKDITGAFNNSFTAHERLYGMALNIVDSAKYFVTIADDYNILHSEHENFTNWNILRDKSNALISADEELQELLGK